MMRTLLVLALCVAAAANAICPPGTCQKCQGGCVTGGLVECFVDPCSSSPCGPLEKCVSNYCGGCNACCVKCDIPKDWTVIGDSAAKCMLIKYLCPVGMVPWSNECGCGCKPEYVRCRKCPALKCASIQCPNDPTKCYGCCTGQCYLNDQGECSGYTPEGTCYL
eukprot:TRINITY_DN1447_c0_g1_i1.p2 TRINITY_DN1447_c0_g1~~TRINITY_DN1447_c0_g1_i1.p2  ORF type:complete len:164 (+),score=29.76 TRINITY_DN1447_c0_g1_i1:63-554(+)